MNRSNAGWGPLYYFEELDSRLHIEKIRVDESRYNDQIARELRFFLAGEEEIPTILFRRRNPVDSPYQYEKYVARKTGGRWEFEKLGDELANDFLYPLPVISDDGSIETVFHFSAAGYYLIKTSQVDGKWRSVPVGEQGDKTGSTKTVQLQGGASIFGFHRHRFSYDSGTITAVGIWENGKFRTVSDAKILRISAGFDDNLYGLGRQHDLDGNVTDSIYEFDGETETWEKRWDTHHQVFKIGIAVAFLPTWVVNRQGEIVFYEIRSDRLSIDFVHHKDGLMKRFSMDAPGRLVNYQVQCDPEGNPFVVGVVETDPGEFELAVFRMDSD